MEVFGGLRNGFCFGLDICAISGDLVADRHGLMIVDGIQFSIGPLFVIFGSSELIEDDGE